MLAIYQKELKTYFKSLFGWLFLAVITFFSSLYFIANNIYYGDPRISYTIQSLVIVLLFALPVLTMRVFAEEKKLKTDQMLLTYPINLWSIIFGKFLALATLMMIVVLVLALGTVFMGFYGDIPVLGSICSLAGFFLFGCICIAIGMFLSAITEHQIVAAILTYLVFIFEMIVPGFLGVFLKEDNFIMKIMSVIDILSPFDKALSSILNLNDLLYIFSAIAIFLILTYLVVGKNTIQLNAIGKNRFFALITVVVIIIAAIVGVNIGCSYIPEKYTNFDLTQNRQYSLTKESKDIIKAIDKEVTIYCLSSKDEADATLKLYLDDYDSSKNIKVEYISPEDNPNFASVYTEEQLPYCSLILTGNDKDRIVSYYDLYESTVDYSTGQSYNTGIDMEGQITSAISYIVSDEVDKIYFVQGHGEKTLSNSFTSILNKGRYNYEDIYLTTITDIPEDCKCLIVNGPSSDFAKEEVAVVKNYIAKGGALILCASEASGQTPNYDSIFAEYAVTVDNGMVFENKYDNCFYQTPYQIILKPEYTPISSKLYDSGKRTMFVEPRAFVIGEDATNVYNEAVFNTSDIAYKKTFEDVMALAESNMPLAQSDADEERVFTLLVNSELTNADGSISKATLIATPYFLTGDIDEIVSNANSEMFVDILNTYTEKELVSTISAKPYYEYISVPGYMTLICAILFIGIIPFGLLITGIVIVIVRMKK